MKTSQFEGVKVAIKQDKTGYVLTLSIHPDEIPEEVMRDYVGSRYQVVMVRLNTDEKPMDREQDLSMDYVRVAGMLCRDSAFHKFLMKVVIYLLPTKKRQRIGLKSIWTLNPEQRLKKATTLSRSYVG